MWSVFIPVVCLVGLTFTVLLNIPARRIRDIKANPALLQDAPLKSDIYSEDATKCANNFNNLLQTPILFYMAAVFALLFGATGWFIGILCWAYVGLRIAHTYVHISTNDVQTRFKVFAGSVLVLALIWLVVIFSAGNSPICGMQSAMADMQNALESIGQ